MADGDRFDPRFDPAFQRGYDEAEPPPAPVVPASVGPAPVGRPAVEQPRGTAERPVEPALSERPHRPHVTPHDGHEDAPARRNPFLIALIVIAVLLIVVSILLFARLPEWRGTVQGDAVMDYATLEVLYFATPLLFVTGLGVIVAVLLFAASRWRRSVSDD